MKKHSILFLLAIIMCMAALTGCSAVKGLEKDLQVILESGGEYCGCYTVNIFNNAVVPKPEAPAGKMFIGWSAQKAGEESPVVPISENQALIRYDDVKDYVKDDHLSVTLYAVFEDMPEPDLVIAWYAKTSTSGLDQNTMDAFQESLYEYLSSQNYKPDEMNIFFRSYEGNVGDTCMAIQDDGDVDIMVGWSDSENLAEKGGFIEGKDFLENVGNVTIGSKARYITRKSETELSTLVYAWIRSKYGA